ncbi:hypothetical protein OHB12_29275 [Nocardia sp. NBC_01730]|uniref:hypothetical protein n=1 Tax=Nocardia sp. NBC_01730 TaxID=2975998 RepID=UPI002E163A5B|nr:hypothetical protein OHB12_29275 [Nocardia sp. NBC_01730]
MCDIRRTEADGFQAAWRLDRHRIAIILVHNTSDATPIASFVPGPYPDLAQAREQLPKLAKLWDAVRHDFWTEFIPHQRHSITSHDNEQGWS